MGLLYLMFAWLMMVQQRDAVCKENKQAEFPGNPLPPKPWVRNHLAYFEEIPIKNLVLAEKAW